MPSLHAACVALGESGVLIRGPSGSGKSSLALLLAAESDGAFVADDRVICERRAGALVARPHDALVGQVEIRGQGILPVQELGLAIRPEAIVRLAIDLVAESRRLPEPPADAEILDLRIPRLVLDRGVRNAGLAPLLIRAALRKQRP
ncbi:HPr kinase/phosphatase C-terminal domain-containing protein [Methylobacterium sp. J-072]|uniref:HPr kinase/phosphorylase n=1 Tax=Methylobacterium sp. J-072 TaxID=2836651 RepID=UPI001FB91754|nr:HPr kinase/phosphatase C-terminal domain-containing protein [Methylobacterium sp. J-072]MCJ2094174.1 HPr kinase/phosphatase C-terminal domain-containing protein [Methylobacterium sp. J-072]